MKSRRCSTVGRRRFAAMLPELERQSRLAESAVESVAFAVRSWFDRAAPMYWRRSESKEDLAAVPDALSLPGALAPRSRAVLLPAPAGFSNH